MIYLRKNQGITVIALVVTVVVLLIIGAVAINAGLGKNGIIDKADFVKNSYTYSQAKEALELKIKSFQLENPGNGSLDELGDYLQSHSRYIVEKLYDEEGILVELVLFDNSTLLEFSINPFFNASLLGIEDELYKKYEKNDTPVAPPVEVNHPIFANYEKVSESGNSVQLKVFVECKNGIEKILCPDGKSIDAKKAESYSFTYTVNKNTEYDFKIKASNRSEENFKLEYTETSHISILDASANSYPVLTYDGVVGGSIVKVIFQDTGHDSYYSTDNGQTWSKYTTYVAIEKDTNLKVKTHEEHKITEIVSKDVHLTGMANNVVLSNAYDDSLTSYDSIPKGTAKRMYFEDDLVGEEVALKFTAKYGQSSNSVTIYFYDSSGTKIANVGQQFSQSGGTTKSYELMYTIPENCAYMEFAAGSGTYNPYIYLYNLKINNRVDIHIKEVDAVLKEAGLAVGYHQVTLVSKKEDNTIEYKVGAETEWHVYTGPFKVENSKEISARGIDKYGHVSPIYKKETTSKILVEKNACDDNNSTYDQVGTNLKKKVYISEELLGEEVAIKITTKYGQGTNSSSIYLYDKDGKQISGVGQSFIQSGGTTKSYDLLYRIPENCSYIEFYSQSGSYNPYIYIYEIKVNNRIDTEIEDIDAKIDSNGVHEGYHKVTLTSWRDKITIEYKVDSEAEWHTYTEPFAILNSQVVSVRGIDKYGKASTTIKTTTAANNILDRRACVGTSVYDTIPTQKLKRLYVDENVWEKKIRINVTTQYGQDGHSTSIYFYGANKTLISGVGQKFSQSGGTKKSYNLTYTIPQNTAYIEFKTGTATTYNSFFNIYELVLVAE